MDEFFIKYREKVRSGFVFSLNGQCRIWIGVRSSNNKYGVVCYKYLVKNKWVIMYVYRFSVMLYYGYYELDVFIVVLYLCYNRLCVVSEYIILELYGINNQRQICRVRGICLGYFSYLFCRFDFVIDMN